MPRGGAPRLAETPAARVARRERALAFVRWSDRWGVALVLAAAAAAYAASAWEGPARDGAGATANPTERTGSDAPPT